MSRKIKYELATLQQKFYEEIDPSKTVSQKTTDSKQFVDKEIDRIKLALLNEVVRFENEQHLQRYIQYHQQGVIKLIDLIRDNDHLSTPPEDTSSNHLSLYHRAFKDIHHFIEKYFTKYLDQTTRPPAFYLHRIRSSIQELLTKFRHIALQKALPKEAVALIVNISEEFVYGSLNNTDTTYQRANYLQNFLKELVEAIVPNLDESETNLAVMRDVLLYLNLNARDAVTFFTDQINCIVADSHSKKQALEKLSYQLKKINQSFVRYNTAYDETAESLKSQLLNYIMQEISYNEGLIHLTFTRSEAPLPTSQPFKLKLNLSVAQYACLLKILCQTGIVQNKNITELLRHASITTMSKKTENLSFDSLRSKFYNIESGTLESVRAILKKLMSC